jgi:arylsulfatase A-like enzyme
MKPNIIFILIDSLRSDKCHGENKTSITPNIDNLIKNGIYFDHTISSAPATAVAMSSIFTGLYPFKTGMGTDGYHKLNPTIPSYIKILKENGYHTYATAPDVASDFGLTCDFENNDSSYNNYFSLFAGLGDQVINRIKSGLPHSPWFFYLHIFDLHTPVIVPKNFDEKEFGDSQYEKMVSAIDSWLGILLKTIDKTNTIVILTADHGEYIPIIKKNNVPVSLESSSIEQKLWELGNKIPSNLYPLKRKLGNVLHGTRKKIKSSKIAELDLSPYEKRILLDTRMGEGHRLFEDLIRVPLLFHGPHMNKSKIISQQVRQVDIFPTLLDIIGIKNEVDVDGQSLVPLMNGEDFDELPACIESPPELKKKTEKVIGIRTSKFKYLRDLSNTKKVLELYDLENDPLEEKNISADNSEIIYALEEKLMKIRQGILIENDETTDEEMRIIEEKLKKLGYT